jgi:hypothetical protein
MAEESYRVKGDFNMHLFSTPNFLKTELLSKPTVFKPIESLDAQLFTSQGRLISIVLLAPLLKVFSATKWRSG